MKKPITRIELATAIRTARQHVAENLHGPPHETFCDALDMLAAAICPPGEDGCDDTGNPPPNPEPDPEP